MALSLQKIDAETPPLELRGVSPDVVRQRSRREIERIEIWRGNRKIPLAEMFRLSGNPSDGVLRFSGELSGVHGLGAGMAQGTIHVEGNVGRRLGSEMTGGLIEIHGNAGDLAGAEMHGGRIHIQGDVGDRAGAAMDGSGPGMRGGEILIEGNAGAEIGRAMRRGLIAVGGAVGDLAGTRMLAGTILAFGDCGRWPGAEMRRGTIGLFGSPSPRLPPTFRFACRHRAVVLAMLLRQLKVWGFAAMQDSHAPMLDLYRGDFLQGGRGEIYLVAPNH